MNVLHPKKSYKLNYIAVVPPLMGILSEIGVWMPILNIFSIFLGIMGIIFGILHISRIKKSTKRKIGEFGLIAIGNIAWIVAMLTCAVMKFSSASYEDNTSSDFIKQLTGFGYSTNKHKQSEDKKSKQEDTDTYAESDSKNIESQKYNIGDIAEFKGVKVTLTDVKKNFKPNDENSNPKQGSQFIKVSMKVENDSNSELTVSENDIKIKDGQGAIETPNQVTHILGNQFENAVLVSGGVREGAVIFEVPVSDTDLKIIYTFPHSDGQRAEFDL